MKNYLYLIILGLVIGSLICIGCAAVGDGADVVFSCQINGKLYAIAIQSDGKIVIGGEFTEVNGESHNYIARINSDGSIDSSFTPQFNNYVSDIAIQSDGKILLGGAFTELGGSSHNYIAWLTSSGAEG